MEPTETLVRRVLAAEWGLRELTVRSWHRTVPTRSVARIDSPVGELAVKINSRPHPSVMGGERVQAVVAESDPTLAPALLPTLSGTTAVTGPDLRVTVSRWIEGRAIPDRPAGWHQVGAAVGRLHRLPPVERPFAVPLTGICAEIGSRSDWPTALINPVLAVAADLARGPSGIVHGQANSANTVQRADGAVTLLDWDESGTGPIALDLGYPLLTNFLDAQLCWHHDRARAFFRGYRANGPALMPSTEDVWRAGLLLGLRSATFADTAERLARVEHAYRRPERMLAAIAGR